MSEQSNPYTSYQRPQSTQSTQSTTSYSYSPPPVSESDPDKQQSTPQTPTAPSKPKKRRSSSSRSYSPPPVSESDPDKQQSTIDSVSPTTSSPREATKQEAGGSGLPPFQQIYSPPTSSTSYPQGTRTDLGEPITISTRTVELEPYRTPEGTFGSYQEDPRSRYQITVQGIKDKLFTQKDTSPLTLRETAVAPVALTIGAAKTGVEFGKGFIGAAYSFTRSVTVDIPQTFGAITTTTADLVTRKTTPKEFLSGVQQRTSQSFQENPAGFAGGLTFDVAAPKIARSTWIKGKDLYVRAGSRYVPPENVFARSVLAGEKKFPEVSSTAESLEQFRRADDVVQTSAPAKLSGTEAGTGRKGGVGLEDPGIYVTPAGEGSPAFLRIDPSTTSYDFTLNPAKIVKGSFDIPTVTRFKTTGVEVYPQSVLDSPGFSAVEEFQRSQAGSGKAFITKRSMIGQGEVPKSQLVVTGDLVTEGGLSVKKGDVRWTAGTVEAEAVVPVTQTFSYTPTTTLGKFKGFDTYTEFGGRPVAIRDTVLTVDRSAPILTGQSRVVTGERLAREVSYLDSPDVRSVVPPFTTSSFPRGVVSSDVVGSSLSSPLSFSESVLPSPSVPVSQPFTRESIVSSPTPTPSAVSPVSTSDSSSVGSRRRPKSLIDSSPVSEPSRVSIVSTPSTPFPSSPVGRSRPTPLTPSPTPPFVRYPSPISSRVEQTRSPSRFIAEVKSRGRFLRTGGATSLEEAWSRGLTGIRTTASASFRILDASTGQAVKPSTGRFAKDLRLSKVDPTVVVQRRGFRISSPGEKRDITAKGIFASKSKKKRGFNLWEL
jgi:hypothetical protein